MTTQEAVCALAKAVTVTEVAVAAPANAVTEKLTLFLPACNVTELGTTRRDGSEHANVVAVAEVAVPVNTMVNVVESPGSRTAVRAVSVCGQTKVSVGGFLEAVSIPQNIGSLRTNTQALSEKLLNSDRIISMLESPMVWRA